MNIHGGGGFDFSECTEEAFHGAVAAHQKHGATTIFPTVLAPEIGVIDKAVAVCEEMMRKKTALSWDCISRTVSESEDGGEPVYR